MSLNDILQGYKSRYEGIKLSIYELKIQNHINIDLIVVPDDFRNEGIGTKVVNDVIRYAQKEGSTICLTPASKDDYETFGIDRSGLKRFWKKGFGENADLKFVLNSGKNRDYEISYSMYLEVQKSDVKKRELTAKAKKTLKFIDDVKSRDTYDADSYESVEDKYLNGECDSLVGYLYELNGEGSCNELCMFYEDDEEENMLFHSVYEIDGFYFDINGVFDSIDDLVANLSYYERCMELEVRGWEIQKDNYYPKIPKHLKSRGISSPRTSR